METQAISYLPKLYLCGFPKSGLHMVEQASSAFVSPVSKNNWTGTSAWNDKITNLDKFLKSVSEIQEGHYKKGHAAHTRLIEQYFWTLGIGVVFIYRDLRDVVVSQANHIRHVDDVNLKHPGADKYRGLSYEQLLIAIIEGLAEYNGIFERFALYAGWLDAEWVHKIRYEDMRRRESVTCKKLYDYTLNLEQLTATDELHHGVIKEMVSRMRNRKQSITFNRGKIGGWKKSFTPKVIDCFKANDPGWIVKLGYAKDNNW